MRESAKKLCKRILIDALRGSSYDINKAQIRSSAGGMFMTMDDVKRANQVAGVIIDGLKNQVLLGKLKIPFDPAELEYEIDFRIWDMSASDSILFINSIFRNRSNKEMVNEAKEAINQLNKMGKRGEEKAYAHEWILKKKIGEV